MKSYNSMVKAMSPVKAYTIDGNTRIDRELKAYAEELDAFSSEIDEILRECLVMTAESEGLSFYEKLIGTFYDNLDTQTRRERIVSLINLNSNDNTLEGIKNFFGSIGLECDILENPRIFDLYISPLNVNFSKKKKKYFINRAKKFLPCHLTFTIDFRTSTWNDYDQQNRTFRQIDSLGKTWEDFEFENIA